jgi:hypothetical protein
MLRWLICPSVADRDVVQRRPVARECGNVVGVDNHDVRGPVTKHTGEMVGARGSVDDDY